MCWAWMAGNGVLYLCESLLIWFIVKWSVWNGKFHKNNGQRVSLTHYEWECHEKNEKNQGNQGEIRGNKCEEAING